MFISNNIDTCDIVIHKKELDILKKMSDDESIPHIIFYGPEGSGKKTIINKFMSMIYNDQLIKTNDTIYKVEKNGNNATDVIIKQSDCHIVIEPNNNNFDKYLIQDVVKEYARRGPLNVFDKKKSFKMVLINGVDNLSYYAQTSLRRTMEKFSGNCRFIMWCRSLSRVIEPIRSRCFCFRIQAPSDGDILELLAKISFKESINLKLKDFTEIISRANGNIKKALWLAQFKKYGISYETSYEKSIRKITELLLSCNVSAELEIRSHIYNIMITNISGTKIMKDIVNCIFLSKNFNEKSKLGIAEIAAKYEHNMIRGRREIIHLEAFIFGVMNILSK
ncbi:replication factor C small subunit [Indivirus ILV1]|uniref:Replication factor C small subunit n=1 Tax=Indivirus ILV1 TaxID=1977633 RepID=A0A1V0SCJ1_9VIRU|nr:replication factor C small subunit [Indivirus ILV1]